MEKEAKKIQERATKAVKLLMDKERIGNKLISDKMAELGTEISVQTVMNYTSLRRFPDVGILITMLKSINDISGSSYTFKDIGLKIGPSFYV